MRTKQKTLVRRFITSNGSITPAFVANTFFEGGHFGSDIARVCRAMRGVNDDGELKSHTNPQGYEVFVFRNAPETRHPIAKILVDEGPVMLSEAEKQIIKDRINLHKQNHHGQ